MTNHTIPPGYVVRYDYHDKPVAITAVLLHPDGRIAAVGVAKFSARDPYFSFETGEQIALGRALRHLKDGYGLGRAPRVDLGELTPLARSARKHVQAHRDGVPGYASGNLRDRDTLTAFNRPRSGLDTPGGEERAIKGF